MRHPQKIQIDAIILHILDSSRGQPQLSEAVIPAPDARVIEYFRSRIEDAAGDSEARPARFQDLKGSSASICQQLLAGGSSLVDGSQELARKLFAILRKNRSIAPGDLAVCRYRAEEDDAEETYLALLKIDPTEALRPVVQKDETGRSYVTFEIETDVLPTLGERLQKCALVRRLDPRPDDFDLLLLDRQRRAGVGPQVARFFTEDFLEAELAFDSRRSTDAFYKRVIRAQNRLRVELTDKQQARLEKQIQGALSQQRVNVDQWPESLGLSQNALQILRDHLAPEHIPDREIEIDSEYIEKALQRRRFQGDQGIRLEVPAAEYGKAGEKKLVEWKKVARAVGAPYFEIVIRTDTWEEK